MSGRERIESRRSCTTYSIIKRGKIHSILAIVPLFSFTLGICTKMGHWTEQRLFMDAACIVTVLATVLLCQWLKARKSIDRSMLWVSFLANRRE